MPLPQLADTAAQVSNFLSSLTAETRLYDLETPLGGNKLLVQRWFGREELSSLYEWQIDCVSGDAAIDLNQLLAQQVILRTRLADGTQAARSGYVRAAANLGTDGSLTRYRLTLAPWLWFATQRRTSRVFQEQTLLQIVEQVLSADGERANWRVGPEVEDFLAPVRPRSYCCQYRESDYAFLTRLLAEEGIGFYFEEVEETGRISRQRLVLFADSTQFDNSGSIRYHRDAAVEESDSIQSLYAHRTLQSAITTISSWDYKAKRVTTTSLTTAHAFGNEHAPYVESYDWAGIYAFASQDEADHYAGIARDAADARFKHWYGESSVRSFRAGTSFALVNSVFDQGEALGWLSQGERRFTLLGVLHAGVNNLPDGLRIEGRAAHDDWRQASRSRDSANDADRWLDSAAWDDLVKSADATGYANRYTAIRADIRWRPVLADGTGALINPKPTASGSQTAIVVGPDGSTAEAGTVHTDALGRIRIRFHWQREESNTCWVRVAQLFAGPGYGAQFIPRIGQEVVVKFLDNDIDRPIVAGVLYNGRGDTDASAFSAAGDHSPAGQANTTGGASPAWHGAAGEHAHAGYLSGFKSTALGTDGYTRQSNQLVFDDTTGRLRTQLSTDAATTQLNLGHLIHQADNYRGSYRGTGWEMRTDAYGALRAGKGILITTTANTQQPAGENSDGIAYAQQVQRQAEAFQQAATTHQTVQFILVKGNSLNGGKGSKIDGELGPMAAMIKALSGTVDAGDGTQIPHMVQPLVAVTAQAGIGVAASNAIHIASGEVTHLHSARDMHIASGDTFTVHSGQAIGVLAGAEKAGEDGTGLSLIAGKDDITIQAQSDTLTLASKDLMQILSANSHVDLAAAKSITIKTEGGASMTIEGGNITFACPGTLAIKSANKAFMGSDRMDVALPAFPGSIQTTQHSLRFAFPGSDEAAGAFGFSNKPYQVMDEDGNILLRGVIPEKGRLPRIDLPEKKTLSLHIGEDRWSSIRIEQSETDISVAVDEIPADSDPYYTGLGGFDEALHFSSEILKTLVPQTDGEQ